MVVYSLYHGVQTCTFSCVNKIVSNAANKLHFVKAAYHTGLYTVYIIHVYIQLCIKECVGITDHPLYHQSQRRDALGETLKLASPSCLEEISRSTLRLVLMLLNSIRTVKPQ